MQTPPDIPAAVAMMRELGIQSMTVEGVTIQLGPLPPAPNAHPKQREQPNPLSVLARGHRLQLRRTEADASKVTHAPEQSDDGSTTR